MTKHGFYSSRWLPGPSLTEGWEITVWPSWQPHFADSITEAREHSDSFSKPKQAPQTKGISHEGQDQRLPSYRNNWGVPWVIPEPSFLDGTCPATQHFIQGPFRVEFTIFHFYRHRSSPRLAERFGQGHPANSSQSWDQTTPSTSHSQLAGMHTHVLTLTHSSVRELCRTGEHWPGCSAAKYPAGHQGISSANDSRPLLWSARGSALSYIKQEV